MGEPQGTPARSDPVLLDRLRAGDDGALRVIYDQHADVVFGVARRVTGDDQLAREIAQEVFTTLWQRPERVDLTRGSLRTYLAVVAHHRAVDEVRRSARRGRAESRAAAVRAEEPEGPEVEILDGAARTSRSGRLAALIEQLPHDQRAALVLAYFGGCTFKEVATRLGIAEGTAKSRLRLAVARLRESLGEEARAWA